MRCVFACLALLLAVPVAALGADLRGPAVVVDGDTLRVDGRRVRLFGIDAPEMAQQCERDGRRYRCGVAASAHLNRLIGGRPVSCRRRDTDRYGRVVAVCFTSGIDLNRAMVDAGWALAYRRYSQDYVRDEQKARVGRRGLWAGVFEAPWRWRAKRR